MIKLTDRLQAAYPGALAGVLCMRNVTNPPQNERLDAEKEKLTATLRSRFADRQEIADLPVIQAYSSYYRRFKKTYHVLLQLESVALKGKSIPNVASLVEAMFMAELKNALLTAGYDYAKLKLPLTMDIAQGDERYVKLNGEEQVVKSGDMILCDSDGVIGSIIYGPDQRSCISPETTDAVFAIYVPPGIPAAAVDAHLRDIAAYVQLVSPEAGIEVLSVCGVD